MSNLASPGRDLKKARSTIIASVDGHHRRTFRAAIAFERTDAERILKRQRHALLQFFCSRQYVLERAEALRRTAPHVRLKKRGRSHHERHLVFGHQAANRLCIEGVRM